MPDVYRRPLEVGQRYGKRVVVAEAGRAATKDNARLVLVRCDCGDVSTVRAPDLVRGLAWACRRCAQRARWEAP